MRKIFVTGIGTDVGKTVISAILVSALKGDYWKPIQAGSYSDTDSQKLRKLISIPDAVIHPEAYCLKTPMSPHTAAEAEGITLEPEKINLPETRRPLIIEGAGGLMVPLNDTFLMVDFISRFNAETIVVIQNYLGSINHSLLTLEVLKYRKVNVLGVIFNGSPHKLSEDIILSYSGAKMLGRVSKERQINQEIIAKYAPAFSGI